LPLSSHGSINGRTATEGVVRAVREAVGIDFLVGARINGEDFTKEGNTLLQSTRVARHLAQLGVGYLSVSAGERFEDAESPPPDTPPFAGTGYSGYRMSPRWWHPDGTHGYLAEAIRKALRDVGHGVPIVTAGKIRTPELGERIIDQGRADIIGLGRALLCDPDWPIKAKEGRADEIVRCAACGYCSEADEKYETITCIQWPEEALNAPSPWLLSPPCKAACPAGVDVRSYIELITEGRHEEALDMIKEKIPLPATIGRVCPHPCEEKCNRTELDDPVAINALKRFVADTRLSGQARKTAPPFPRTKQERVAIIGAGPAGLTAAYHLVKSGYRTTIFEALPIPGGMLAVGIPAYRLPKPLLQTEITDIQGLGVEIKLNTRLGSDGLTIDRLRQQGYRAVLLATGAHKSLKLDVPGADVEAVCDGTTFLRDVNLGRERHVPEKVAVVGGGNVAVDAARTALRLGANEVFIVYRRSRDEMPAYGEEVEAAENEGISIHYLATPVQIVSKNGRVTGIECVRTELCEPDAEGRKRPVPIAGSEFVSEAGMVILATGEVPDLSFLSGDRIDVTPRGTIEVNSRTQATSLDGVFAGGDVVTGPATVIDAIAAGRKAAESIDRYLCGQTMVQETESPDIIGIADLDTARFRKQRRQTMPVRSSRKRIHGFSEVARGFSAMAALCEADRCLRCGMYPNKERHKRDDVRVGG